MHQLSLPEDKLSLAHQIILEYNHTMLELQGQLSGLTATQGSFLLTDAEQEKKEGRVLNLVRDELYHQTGHLQTLESMNVKLGDGGGVVEAEVGVDRWEREV